jgi:hypothetical protein
VTPKPYAAHRATTTFVRVPAPDWLLVKHGHKTEFRSGDQRYKLMHIRDLCPTPVVAYALVNGGHDAQLMVLERFWFEPVGSISEESLSREGFETFADFRRYYKLRTHRPFRPLQDVWCFRVRPWTPADAEEHGQRLLTRLYGEFM